MKLRGKRGAVLLLVLGAVAILAVLAVELSHRSNVDALQAARARRNAAFRQAFASGVELAKGRISDSRSGEAYDSPADDWAKPVEYELGPGERVRVRVVDESGKLNIRLAMGTSGKSSLQQKALERLFEYVRENDSARAKEWEDVQQRLFKRLGISSDAAGAVEPAPIYTLDNLREAGIPAVFVYGEAGEDGRRSLALADLVTLQGNGFVNLNTAHKAVLYSLDVEFENGLVDAIDAWRGTLSTRDEPGDAGIRPFKTTADLEAVPGIVQVAMLDGKPKVIKNLHTKVKDRISVRSDGFGARIEVEVDGRKKEAWAFFEFGRQTVTAGTTAKPAALLSVFEELEP